MFGVEVNLPHDVPMPTSTASYSYLQWVDLDLFLLVAVSRDATLLPSLGLKAAEVCVHGLCMHSAVEILRASRPHLIRPA